MITSRPAWKAAHHALLADCAAQSRHGTPAAQLHARAIAGVQIASFIVFWRPCTASPSPVPPKEPHHDHSPHLHRTPALHLHGPVRSPDARAPSLATAQSKLKVAAIYTVPFEQQWVSRIHKALKAAEARGEIEYKASENVSNADYERVMREYATGGNQLIVGEAFAVEAAARKVAKDFPKTSFLLGSSGKPQAPNFSVFDNYIQEPRLPQRHDRGRHDQDQQDRHGRRLPHPRSPTA